MGSLERRYRWLLMALLLAGAALRAAYLAGQPAADPWFSSPELDGRHYVAWAQAIAHGGEGPAGAFYLAPLYPYALAAAIRLGLGSFPAIYALQHLLTLLTAALLAGVARRRAGPLAGLATAAIVLFHHPLLFFASRPLGETLAIAIAAAAVAAADRDHPASGFLGGAAALARPNLVLAPLVWAAAQLAGGRGWRAAALVGGAALAVAPAAIHNLAASGHLVPISSNGGLTLYHGNGPGARGVFTRPAELSADFERQREEAVTVASRLAGRPLDAVEADAFWGRQALRARLADPAGTARLLARKVALVFSNAELGLDAAPALDDDPWRPTWRLPGGREVALVPWAAILALAAAGLLARGARGSGGWALWGAVLAALAAPIIFYVSSRYRLPAAALLAVPAGVGASALAGLGPEAADRRRVAALVAAAATLALSLAIPTGGLERTLRAEGLANRAAARERSGDLERAAADAERAVDLAPASAQVRYVAGVVAERRGLAAEAERAYAEAIRLDPGFAEAAGNLAALKIAGGRAAEAIPILRLALARRPHDATCWTNLVVALYAAGDAAEARQAAARAGASGVRLDPGLLSTVGAPEPATGERP